MKENEEHYEHLMDGYKDFKIEVPKVDTPSDGKKEDGDSPKEEE